jgi:hypothetical protein
MSRETEHIIITRFNYRFKKTDELAPLIEHNYWNARLELFQKFCLPSVMAQKNKDFSWVIIIDPELPESMEKELDDMINRENVSHIRVILYKWNFGDSLSDPSWLPIEECKHKKYLVTTRLDNDDALSLDFTQRIKNLSQTIYVNGFVIVSYSRGYTWNDSKSGSIYKQIQAPMIALGLTMIADTSKYPLTIYCGRHTRLLSYLKTPSEHKIFKTHYENNGELQLSRQQQQALARKRYKIVRVSTPIFIRTIHDTNHQKNLVQSKKEKNNKNDLIKKYFNLKV